MTPDTITVHSGVVTINGSPFMRFASTAWAYVFLANLGYRPVLREDLQYAFVKQ